MAGFRGPDHSDAYRGLPVNYISLVMMAPKSIGWIYLLLIGCCLLSISLGLSGCQKDQLVTGSGALIFNSADTVDFDQVFATAIQPTQSIKLSNGSEKDIDIHALTLAGGENSPFKINLNGRSGTHFTEVPMAKDDSLYIFVTLIVPEHSTNTPFDVTDSIVYHYGDKTDKIILHATGLNAYFLPGGTITGDTTWTNERPIVVKGNIIVAAGATLHVGSGTRVYTQAGKGIRINGRLRALGTPNPEEQILFTGSRLDAPYNNMPGSWQGLSFGAASTGNTLQYVQIKNAVNAITDTSKSLTGFTVQSQTALTMDACTVMQSAKAALLFRHSSALINNCLIYNSGQALKAMGGNYTLNYLTLAGYSNDYLFHTDPLIYLADHADNSEKDPLRLTATNCIITGDNDPLDELLLDSQTDDFDLAFKNCLIKIASQPTIGSYTDCLFNQDPAFVLIDNRRSDYDFQLLSVSPVTRAGIPISAVTNDILNQPRSESAPSIGCYEFKESATN